MPQDGIIEVDKDDDFKLLKCDPKIIKMMETAIEQNAKVLDTNIKIINHCLIASSAIAVITKNGPVLREDL